MDNSVRKWSDVTQSNLKVMITKLYTTAVFDTNIKPLEQGHHCCRNFL